MATSEMEKKNNSQKWKLLEKPPEKWKYQLSDMENFTKFEIWSGNSEKLKLSENWNPKRKLSELNTIRKKCICSQINIVLKWNFQHSDMNTWIRSQHKQKSFRMKFLIVLPQPKAHAKPLRPESCSPIFPPKKTWNLNCDLGAPLFEDVWTMFEWQNVEGSFQVFILKRMGPYWCQVHAKQLQCPPNHPQPIPIPKCERPRKKTIYYFFSGVLQTSVFHFGVQICFTREKSCILDFGLDGVI